MYAAQLALNISLGYVAFSFLCGALWIAAIRFWRARPPRDESRRGRAILPNTKTPPGGGARWLIAMVNAKKAITTSQMTAALRWAPAEPPAATLCYWAILLILAPCREASPIRPFSPNTNARTGFLSV